MLKMKDEPTMLMKTQGHKTKCPLKWAPFSVLFPRNSAAISQKTRVISQYYVRAFGREEPSNRRAGSPCASSPEATSQSSSQGRSGSKAWQSIETGNSRCPFVVPSLDFRGALV